MADIQYTEEELNRAMSQPAVEESQHELDVVSFHMGLFRKNALYIGWIPADKDLDRVGEAECEALERLLMLPHRLLGNRAVIYL